jgi:site-specific DNA-cytosine methylase
MSATLSWALAPNSTMSMSLSVSTADSVQLTSKVQPLLNVFVNALPTAVPSQMSNVMANANVEVKYADVAAKRKFVDLAVADTNRKKGKTTVVSNLVRPITTRRPLFVGSACCGWCSEKFALDKLGIHDYVHMFACDINKWSKKFNVQNVPSQRWYVDCLSDAHKNAPYVDLYIAGFPWEQVEAGHPLRVEDFRGILDYITRRQPAVFILENVKTVLDTTNRDAWFSILRLLANIRTSTGQVTYSVFATILNSKHYGVPQDRERVYVVGRRLDMINGDKSTFKQVGTADTMAKPPSMRKFLSIEHEVVAVNDIRQSATSRAMKTTLKAAHNALVVQGLPPPFTDAVVDLRSVNGLNMLLNMCQSITPTGGQKRSYYLTSVGRRLTAFELCRLQGLDPLTPNWNGIPDSAIGAMAGNSMTVPVLAHVIREALLSTGLAQPGGGAPIVFP